jgi:hypothetical protein
MAAIRDFFSTFPWRQVGNLSCVRIIELLGYFTMQDFHPHEYARRLLLMVRELHLMGYERLRIAPSVRVAERCWWCSITHTCNIQRNHGAKVIDRDRDVAVYNSLQENQFFDWIDALFDSPRELAEKFVVRFPDLAKKGAGKDTAYARWYAEMIGRSDPLGVPYAEAYWDFPKDCLPFFNLPEGMKFDLPPGGEGKSK